MAPYGRSAFVHHVGPECPTRKVPPEDAVAQMGITAVVIEASCCRGYISAHGVIDREERTSAIIDTATRCGGPVVTDFGVVDQRVARTSHAAAVISAADMDAASQVRRRIGCNDRVGYGPRSPVLEENTSAVCCLSATDDESVDTGIATDPAAAVRIIRRSVEDDDVASVTVHDRLMQGVVPFVQIRFPCTEAAVDFDTVVIDHIRLALRRHVVPFGHPDTVALRSQAKRLIDRRESIRPVRSVTASATYVPVDKVSEVLFVKHQIHHEGRVARHFVSPRTGCGREMKRDLFLSGRVPNYLRTGRYRCRRGSALESPLDA